MKLKLETIAEGKKLRQFVTTPFMSGSPRATYQAFITWFYRKATLRNKTPKSLLLLYNIFPKKLIATSPLVNIVPLIAKPTNRMEAQSTKFKHSRLAKTKANSANKHTKKNWEFKFL